MFWQSLFYILNEILKKMFFKHNALHKVKPSPWALPWSPPPESRHPLSFWFEMLRVVGGELKQLISFICACIAEKDEFTCHFRNFRSLGIPSVFRTLGVLVEWVKTQKSEHFWYFQKGQSFVLILVELSISSIVC